MWKFGLELGLKLTRDFTRTKDTVQKSCKWSAPEQHARAIQLTVCGAKIKGGGKVAMQALLEYIASYPGPPFNFACGGPGVRKYVI